jgi:hypothetical protein
MSKYIFLFRGGLDLRNASPAEQQANMMKWKTWMEQLAAKGKLLFAEPLQREGQVLRGSTKKITDGPFVEGKEVVGGCMVVEASGPEEAAELSKGCPIFDHEGSVEVRPVMQMPV